MNKGNKGGRESLPDLAAETKTSGVDVQGGLFYIHACVLWVMGAEGTKGRVQMMSAYRYQVRCSLPEPRKACRDSGSRMLNVNKEGGGCSPSPSVLHHTGPGY